MGDKHESECNTNDNLEKKIVKVSRKKTQRKFGQQGKSKATSNKKGKSSVKSKKGMAGSKKAGMLKERLGRRGVLEVLKSESSRSSTSQISTKQEVPTSGFRVVNLYGDIREKVVPDPNNGDKRSEDTSDAKYHKLHSSREKAEKKIVEKQRQSDKWERRNKREKGNRKTNRRHEVKVRRNMRLGPEPCDATHISVEENLPSSVLGREMPPIISEPFELPGCKDSKDQFEEEA